MVELNYKNVLGVLLLVIATASGTYFLEKTNQYKSCQGTWDVQDSGQYKCSKTQDVQWCYSIEYRGSGWNRCYVGRVVNVEKPATQFSGERIFCNGEWWVLQDSKPSDYSILVNENGNKQAYYSECVD